MKKLTKKEEGGPFKKQVKGSKGTYTATKSGKVMSGKEGRLTSIDTTGYAKGKKDYTVKIQDFVNVGGRLQRVGSESKIINRKEVTPTIKKMEKDIKKTGGSVKTKKKK